MSSQPKTKRSNNPVQRARKAKALTKSQLKQAKQALKHVETPKQQRKNASTTHVLTKPIKESSSTRLSTIQVVDSRDSIGIDANLSIPAVQEMCVTWMAYFIAKGILSNSDIVPDQVKWYNGFNWLTSGILKHIAGETVLDKLPRFSLHLMRALQAKKIPFKRYGKISFSWNEIPSSSATTTYVLPWSKWVPTVVLNDNNTYLAGATDVSSLVVPSLDDYQQTTKTVQGIDNTNDYMTELVNIDENTPLDNDVSAFSKIYSYNGLNPSNAGGYYNDVELEVEPRAPLVAHFASYDSNFVDVRVPTKFQVNSGGAAVPAGLPLSRLWKSNGDYFNKIPPVFKQIDFNEIVNSLVYAYIHAVTQAASAGQGLPSQATFQFTYQDFCIAVRQALLSSVFREQYMTQFIGAVNYDSASSTFLPFMVMNHTYGSTAFNDFRVPTLVKENINSLGAATYSVKPEGGSKINNVKVLPVLGTYNRDTPPVFVIPGGESGYPVFADTPQTTINLIDGTAAQNYVNLNGGYYITVMAMWNARMSALDTVMKTDPLGNCTPMKGLALLDFTRVIEKKEQFSDPIPLNPVAAPLRLDPPCYKFLDNARPRSIKKGANVEAIPPATAAELTYTHYLARHSIIKECYQFLRILIVPSLRLTVGSAEDQIKIPMYQIETSESIDVPTPKPEVYPMYLERANLLGQYCVQGLAKDSSSSYDDIMRFLTETGRAGMLSGLLAGVAKGFFPGNDNMIDSIASIIPL